MHLRFQLPGTSPLAGRTVLEAVAGLRGDRHAELQAMLQHRYSASSSILCGSGTQALQIAIAIGRARTEAHATVAIPAFSCYDMASAAIGAGGHVDLYDIDPSTLAPDLASLRSALENGVRVVVVAPLYGIPIDWEPLTRLAAGYGAVLIEDAAQGHGASLNGHPLGSFGDISTLSFGRGKGWTGGGGGAVLSRGAQAEAERLSILDGGRNRKTLVNLVAHWALARPGIYGVPRSIPALGLGETTYHAPVVPHAMAGVALVAILEGQTDSDREAGIRRANAAALIERLLGEASVEFVRVPPGGVAGYLRLPLRLPRGMGTFSGAQKALRLGIAPSYPTTLTQVDALRQHLVRDHYDVPGAENLAQMLVTLPTHSLVTKRDREAIADVVRTSVRPPF